MSQGEGVQRPHVLHGNAQLLEARGERLRVPDGRPKLRMGVVGPWPSRTGAGHFPRAVPPQTSSPSNRHQHHSHMQTAHRSPQASLSMSRESPVASDYSQIGRLCRAAFPTRPRGNGATRVGTNPGLTSEPPEP
eukprot:scaffold93_cov233-Pinguiococcus_pyrenoidosus.AAC.1